MGPGDDSVAPNARLGYEFNAFERREQIGSGGNADVYRATVDHDGSQLTVALKTPRMSEYETVDTSFFEEFIEEARLWNRIDDHENIVSVLDWGESPYPWIALEYMEAGNLATRGADLPLDKKVQLFTDVCNGVFNAHRHGVTHGDLKPENLMLTREGGRLRAKVGDWGLAKVLLDHSQSAEEMTLAYSAPEQVSTDEYGAVNDRTDIYQLGVIAFELLTGELPYDDDNPAAIVNDIVDRAPSAPSLSNPNLDGDVDTAILTALAKDKSDRYEAVPIFRDAVTDAVRSEGTKGRTTTSDTTGRAQSTSSSARIDSTTNGPKRTAANQAPSSTHSDPSTTSPTPSEPTQGKTTNTGKTVERAKEDPTETDRSSTGIGRTESDNSQESDSSNGDSQDDGILDRFASWWEKPQASELDLSTGVFTAAVSAYYYPRTTDSKTAYRGAISLLLYLVAYPMLFGYLLSVMKSAANGKSAAPEFRFSDWWPHTKRGVAGTAVLAGPLVITAMIVGGSSSGNTSSVGSLLILVVFYISPWLLIAYVISGDIRTALDPKTAYQAATDPGYFGTLIVYGVLFFGAYVVTAFSVLTLVGALVVGFYMLAMLASYLGLRAQAIDLPVES